MRICWWLWGSKLLALACCTQCFIMKQVTRRINPQVLKKHKRNDYVLDHQRVNFIFVRHTDKRQFLLKPLHRQLCSGLTLAFTLYGRTVHFRIFCGLARRRSLEKTIFVIIGYFDKKEY